MRLFGGILKLFRSILMDFSWILMDFMDFHGSVGISHFSGWGRGVPFKQTYLPSPNRPTYRPPPHEIPTLGGGSPGALFSGKPMQAPFWALQGKNAIFRPCGAKYRHFFGPAGPNIRILLALRGQQIKISGPAGQKNTIFGPEKMKN